MTIDALMLILAITSVSRQLLQEASTEQDKTPPARKTGMLIESGDREPEPAAMPPHWLIFAAFLAGVLAGTLIWRFA